MKLNGAQVRELEASIHRWPTFSITAVYSLPAWPEWVRIRRMVG